MSRRVLFVWMLVSALAVVVPKAWAQRPPQMDPPSGVITQDVVMSWDRSAIPASIELWPRRTLIAHDHLDPSKQYGALFFTCVSASDSATGRCAVEDTHDTTKGAFSEIAVAFTEQRTGLRYDTWVSSAIERIDATGSCSADYWRSTIYWPHSSSGNGCFGLEQVGMGGVLLLNEKSLQRLTAGHWKGTLELRLRRPPSEHLATYVFNFDFTITDYDAVAIYLPGFENGNANVNMDLRYDPRISIGNIAGSKDVDMCLYDGLGSQSEYLGVTVRDTGSNPSTGDDYSLWHRDATGDERERVSFNVWLNYAGSKRRMRNGVEEQLLGVDKTALRLVKLPKLDQPVYCVPTPITLETPAFTASSKREGVYTGELKVELRVPTVRP
ncbi:CfaE/CblD family pilus tip adhesin [Stenotrophomonas sp. PFBMAA-4]|uniref:CfaE/CblD family pilus tip adhesin n=1 Tax=Stenotrophomonas sp. PFBMAA-4 TaxID=3043301 RepID=UPI0024B5DDC1|nr:CfaE/CblD family pilus tip adhesin [Stenotrophomonas sp. PFBMAA-4]MDI9273909.1 CfaE/CblD family pilus tip adhesin [Stenotrophomonas sp. PFBMAA-4]